jgi:hypothetical protein
MAKTKFPTLAVILLIFAVFWIADELGYLVFDIPWIPVVLAVIAIGMIANRYNK